MRELSDEQLEEWVKEKMYDPHKAIEDIEEELDNLAKDLAHTRALTHEKSQVKL